MTSSSRQRVLLAFVLLLAAAIRLLALGRESLWLDEVISVWQVQRSLPEMMRFVAVDIHPPLYYLLLHGWLAVWSLPPAGGEALVRFPSALASLFSLPVIYLAGRRLGGSAVGLAAAALLAVFPLDVWYAREARMYSLAALWTLVAIWAGIRVASRDRWHDHVAFALAVLAGVYTHYPFGLLWVAGFALVPILAHRKGRALHARHWLVTQAGIVAGLIPLVPFAAHQAGGALGHSLWQWALALPETAGIMITLLVGVLVLGVIAAPAMLGVNDRRDLLHALSRPGLVGALGFLVIGVTMWRPISSVRQFVLFTPALLLALAWVCLRRPAGRATWAHGLLIGTFILGLAASGYLLSVPRKEGWRDVVALVGAEGQPQDGVLVHAGYLYLPFKYYYRGDLPVHWAAEGADWHTIPPLANDFRRTWLVEGHLDRVDPNREVESWFDQHNRLVKQQSFRALTVRLYEMP